MTQEPRRPSSPTRRQVLRAGALGAAGTAVLAACGKSAEDTGVSGAAPATTLVEPTVPTTEPSKDALSEDTAQRSTLASIELLVASVYTEQGPKLDGERAALAKRFASDHEAAARGIREIGEVDRLGYEPNKVLADNLVEPKIGTLIDAEAILTFMAQLESTLVATYITAAGVLTGVVQRQQMMTYGAACARRIGVLGPGDAGAPTDALFSLFDLVTADAYVGRPKEGA